MNPAGGHTILVSPVGEIPEELTERLCREIGRVLGFETRVARLLADIGFAYDAGRDQYHSTAILERLAALAPPDALKVLAVVNEDLFIPILTHVYGEAQLGGTAGVVSTCRLKQETRQLAPPGNFFERMAKEAIHELGHTFNLRHCPETDCIMHYCRSEEDVDRKSDQLCRYCRVLLADELKRLGR